MARATGSTMAPAQGHGGGVSSYRSSREFKTWRPSGKGSVTDYGSTVLHWMHGCLPRYKGSFKGEFERPSASYIIDFLPPSARVTAPADSVPVKHLHSSLNKVKHPVNIVRWTPEGRRLLTASTSGEFTLWNGTGFNFETIMQAHDSAIRALEYSHSDDWLLSGDHDGIIKYWQPNFNNVQSIHGHNDPIRDIAFSPTDAKFVTASDDSTLKIFDFAGGVEETTLTGHGWDAKSCDWHPTKGLLVSGSKDHLVKLWDPRTGRCLTTLHGHKNTITKTLFERVRGQCLATSARDQVARVLDLRMMRDICLLKGYDKDVTKDITTLTWHPIHPSLLSTGGMDGSMMHYILDEPNTPPDHRPSIAPYDSPDPTTCPAQVVFPAHRVKHAHDMAIWSLHWHPLGHILASGSNDRITRFWARARPGDTDWARDRYHIGEAAAEVQGTWDRRGHRRMRLEEEEQEMEDEMEGLVDQKMPIKRPASQVPGIPGLPLQGRPPPPSRLPPPPLGSIMPGASTLPPHPSLPLPLPLSLPLPPLPFALPGLSNGSVPQLPPPPLPAFDPTKPPNLSLIAELMQKAGLPLPPPGLLPPPPSLSFPLPSLQDVDRERERRSEAGRRRAPLPTQEESLRLEQSRGHFTRAR